jgi:hypothetical protein
MGGAGRRRVWRKWARRWLVGLGGVVIVVGVVFLLLPVWISNEQGRTYVLQRVNRNLAGTLDIKHWSVSWWRGMELDELSLTLPNGRRIVHCPHIQTELTLWSLLWGSYDVGNARLPGASMALTKYADGSTDVTRLFPQVMRKGSGLRSLRGAIQISGGDLTLSSERSGRAVTLTDFSAEVTIASPVAPFYVRMRGFVGGPTGRAVSCDAVMPAMASWPADEWEVLSGVDLTAGGLPTAVVADWAGLGRGWEEALGAELDTLRFQSEGVGGGAGVLGGAEGRGSWIPSLQVRGVNGKMWIDAKLLCSSGLGSGRGARLSMPGEWRGNPRDVSGAPGVRDFRCEAALGVSEPVWEVLRRVNPVLGELRKAEDVVGFRVQSLDVAVEAGVGAVGGTMVGTVKIPAGELANEGVLREILRSGNAVEGGAVVGATFGPLVVRLEGQELVSDRFTIVARGRGVDQLSFSGRVSLGGEGGGKVGMVVRRVRVGGAGLGTSTVEMPLVGTVDEVRVVGP